MAATMQSETHSATPTIYEDRSENASLNEETGRELYPGPEEKKKNFHLVEFDENDPLNPKVRHPPFFPRSFQLIAYRHGPEVIDGISQCYQGFWC